MQYERSWALMACWGRHHMISVFYKPVNGIASCHVLLRTLGARGSAITAVCCINAESNAALRVAHHAHRMVVSSCDNAPRGGQRHCIASHHHRACAPAPYRVSYLYRVNRPIFHGASGGAGADISASIVGKRQRRGMKRCRIAELGIDITSKSANHISSSALAAYRRASAGAGVGNIKQRSASRCAPSRALMRRLQQRSGVKAAGADLARVRINSIALANWRGVWRKTMAYQWQRQSKITLNDNGAYRILPKIISSKRA